MGCVTTLALSDEIGTKAADVDRNATIEHLIRNEARAVSDSNADNIASDSGACDHNIEPLFSALYYYCKFDGTSKPVHLMIARHEAAFRLTLSGDDEVEDRSVRFSNLTELIRALEEADDPRIGASDVWSLYELFSENGWLRGSK